MFLKKIHSYILSSEKSLRERLFILIMTITIALWMITLVEIMFTGSKLIEILTLVAGILLFVLVTVISVRKDRIGLGAVIISAGMIFVYLPFTYFCGGGVYGDAPLWFLFSIFFVNMCLEGKALIVMLILDFATAGVCWGLSYEYPSLVIPNNSFMAHIFSFIALVIIGLCMSMMISFRNKMYARETKRSEEQKKEIEALNRAQNHFFSSMSHEIRTPINTIIALNEMILRENISEEVAEDAANIQSASKILLHLINDILDMSKFASGQMQLSVAPYATGDMLSEIVGMLWIRAKEKKLDFRVSVAPDIPAQLMGDDVRIKQILINVLNNAIKYTKEGSVSLSIQSGEVNGGVMNVIYTVSDTGIGIKKENIPYLFTAFRRVDEEKNRHIEGTGLGLSIVKQFVDLMGGRITVNSIYTKGSSFIIEIPQRIVGEDSIGEITIRGDRPHERIGTHAAKFEAPDAKVLVVDDNASNLLVVSKLLRDTKVRVDTVSSGAEALKLTLGETYHVIFMDHLMPEMDGIECFHAIRTQIGGKCREAKVVALTANAGTESKLLYEKEGFDGYLVKPISGDVLEKELYRLLPHDLTYVSGDSEEILRETVSWMKNEQRKKTVAITTESVADLPQELIDRYGIAVLPHLVVTKEGEFLDGVEIETRGLLEYMEDLSRKVATRAPDVQTIESFFAAQLANANNIVHISISSELANSGCPVAVEASRAFDNVTVIDTGHLSSGQGLMVIEACRLAEEGKSAEEITAHLNKMHSRIHTSFVVDNLDFLARCGQVSHRIASITKSLMARPVLVLKRGKMGVGRVYFGNRKKAWRKYIESVLRRESSIDKRILFVTYVGLTKRDMDWIRAEIEKRAEFDAIYFTQASPVIAVNCGAGTFGLLIRDSAYE
ncbi:MAG: DegV family EDD domain-containing protein [Ruminococcus sp.]|nr:DegV family EDD domain-containing protein [Ruminococcus sp.]